MPSVHALIINNELATEHGWGELADVCVQYQLLKYLNSIVINIKHHIFITTEYYSNETPTVRGLATDKNKLYTETMIFLWNNQYNLNFNV